MSSGVSYLVVFCALALHLNPDERAIVMYGNDQAFERFVQEVRRFYPFAQGMGGIARKDIQWRGYAIPGKTLLILDLYGTNHDARTWPIRTCSARRGSSNGTKPPVQLHIPRRRRLRNRPSVRRRMDHH
jgi:hypothetical protein